MCRLPAHLGSSEAPSDIIHCSGGLPPSRIAQPPAIVHAGRHRRKYLIDGVLYCFRCFNLTAPIQFNAELQQQASVQVNKAIAATPDRLPGK